VVSRGRLENIKDSLELIELLNVAKQYLTYKELSRALNLPETVLSRYVKGHVLPTQNRCEQLRKTLMEAVRLGAHIADIIAENGPAVIRQVNANPHLLWFITQHVAQVTAGKTVTKILTVTDQSIPIATLASQRFTVPLAIASRYKAARGAKHFEAELPSADEPYNIRTLYLPRELMRNHDHTLILTDILTDGAIQTALQSLVCQAGAATTLIYAILTIGDEWKRAFEKAQVDSPVHFFAESVLREKPEQETGRTESPSLR
jgi:adenine phosphoribosyltransferase